MYGGVEKFDKSNDKEAVHSWLRNQPKAFCSQSIRKLIERCKKNVLTNKEIILKSNYFVV